MYIQAYRTELSTDYNMALAFEHMTQGIDLNHNTYTQRHGVMLNVHILTIVPDTQATTLYMTLCITGFGNQLLLSVFNILHILLLC